MTSPISILVCALGGEGGGVLAEWLVDLATRCGHAAQSTSIPGVAQRTGATTYYIEIAREPGPTRPVFSLYAVPGALDLLIASELLEAARQVAAGMVTRERTRVIASSERTLTTFEKMQMGDGRADSERLLHVLRDYSRRLDTFPMSASATEARSALSAVMLGAIAGSGELPFPRVAFETTIRASGKSVETSLAGFALGFGRVTQPAEALHAASSIPEAFPESLQAMLDAGCARTREWQDDAYAEAYLRRVERILAAERAVDPEQAHDFEATRETARFLASWMAFDDVVRVADLKSRASRYARLRNEVHAVDDDLVRVYDHLKPGIPELAGMLSPRLAEAARRWDRRRIASGKRPFAIPMKLPAHSILGLLALRLVASLKGLRKRSSRYAAEQAMIERWLAAIETGLRSDWQLGRELALCGRLIKGYGATNERGKENLLHVIEYLATTGSFATPGARAAAIREARESALVDDAGKALDATLVAHGAPSRPVKAQPIVWMRKPSGGTARKAA